MKHSKIEKIPLEGFPPIEDEMIRLLVLGSFPSVKSLEDSFYYAHPQNQFWRILSVCWNETIPASIDDKKKWALSHRLGIWDVFASCEREGSLDQALTRGMVNDLEPFIASHRSLERVLLNGSLAASAFRKASRAWTISGSLEIIALPSSSPVPSKNYRRIEDKIPLWKDALGI